MRFAPLPLAGAFVIDQERRCDHRGWFARTFCRDEFAAHGLIGDFVQCSASFNARRGTLRGLHFQHAPHAETKLVRCIRGAVFDVLLDLRPHSATFGDWHAVELSDANGVAVYVPAGVAHGFQSLTDASGAQRFAIWQSTSEASDGVRWDDPAFGIDWPIRPPILSERDAGFGDFRKVVPP